MDTTRERISYNFIDSRDMLFSLYIDFSFVRCVMRGPPGLIYHLRQLLKGYLKLITMFYLDLSLDYHRRFHLSQFFACGVQLGFLVLASQYERPCNRQTAD